MELEDLAFWLERLEVIERWEREAEEKARREAGL